MFDNIFISYASEDVLIAKKIYNFLEINGYKPWMDKHKLLPGQNWDFEIQKALRNADFVIMVLSQSSVQKRGYVQREFKVAIEYTRDKLDDDIYIIPIKIGNCEVPNSLLKYQWIAFDDEPSLESLLSSIKIQVDKYIDFEKQKLGLENEMDYKEVVNEEKMKNGKSSCDIFTSTISFRDVTNKSLVEINRILEGKTSEYLINARKRFDEIDYDSEMHFSFDLSHNIQFLGKDLISITENLFEYTGGAHGNYASIGQNFILHPTFTIDLHSLVNYDELDKVLKFISKYCIDDLKEQYKDELGENFKNGDDVFFEGSLDPILENFDNFLLNKNSIDFLFNPYQILPYAYGASVVSIPYDAFKKQIKNQEKINFVLSKL